MNANVTIRCEQEKDRRTVEEITREAFYNIYMPGCAEHYLIHIMRGHEDFLPELALVMEMDGRIIGNIMYTKAKLIGESKKEKGILTFGPVCILPEYQRMGYGRQLIEYSVKKAAALGYDAIVIFGSPSNYAPLGFKSSKRYNISLENGSFPSAMLAKELKQGALDGSRWIYRGSPVMQIDEQEAQRFDSKFGHKEKKYLPSQEEFYIYSNSVIQQAKP